MLHPIAHQTHCTYTSLLENHLQRYLSQCSNAASQEHKAMPKIYLFVLIVELIPHWMLLSVTTNTFLLV